MIIIKNSISVDEYNYLRGTVGWSKYSNSQSKKALDNSLFVVAVYYNSEIVGMGRIVGDGAVICYIQDLIISPTCQGMGIGTRILNDLQDYVKNIQFEDTTMMLCLMSAKGREEFYIKNGFIARPTTDLGPGMIKYFKQ